MDNQSWDPLDNQTDPIGSIDDSNELEERRGMIAAYSKFCVAIALGICCTIGFYGNTMSALIFLHTDMRSPINTLLAAISIIFLTQLLLIIPMLILPSLNLTLEDEFLFNFYKVTIFYLYPLGMMSQTAGMWVYVLITVERYVAVCKPLKSYKLLTNRQTKCALFVIILVAILYNMVRFWEYQWDLETGFKVFLRDDQLYFIFYFTTLHLITHFLLPISIIVIMHTRIIFNLKHAYDDRLSLRYSNGSNGTQRVAERRQKSTTLMILVSTGLFVCCHIAPFLINLWETFDVNAYRSTFLDIVSDISNLLLAVHSAFSFLIYMKFCRQYRQLFLRLMGLRGRKNSDTMARRNRRHHWGAFRRSATPQFSDCGEASGDMMTTSFRARVTSDLICLNSR